MDMNTITMLTEFLKATNPYGIVAILAWALWKQSMARDDEAREMREKLVEFASDRTHLLAKLDDTLNALKDVIASLRSH